MVLNRLGLGRWCGVVGDHSNVEFPEHGDESRRGDLEKLRPSEAIGDFSIENAVSRKRSFWF